MLKAEYHAARVAHDHAKAAGLLQETTDLTHLTTEFAEGLALSRQRHMTAVRAWPLGMVI